MAFEAGALEGLHGVLPAVFQPQAELLADRVAEEGERLAEGGHINGTGDYRLVPTAGDGKSPNGVGDRVRITIWNRASGDVPTTALGLGDIVIHHLLPVFPQATGIDSNGTRSACWSAKLPCGATMIRRAAIRSRSGFLRQKGGNAVAQPPASGQVTKRGRSIPSAGKRPHSRRWWLRRITIGVLIAILVGAVATLGIVGWIGSERAIHRPQNTYSWSLADYPNLQAQPVTIQSRTGITLAGRFFPGRSRTTIILSHGYGDNQDQMIPWADFLNRAGYSVFTYDMRSRGQSGGDAITLGALEQEDLLSVIDYVAARPDVDASRIGALGVSLGGATTIMAAARDTRIKAVVDDCGFSDAPGVVDTAFEYYLKLPAFPFAPVTVKIGESRTGQDFNSVRPVDVVARISPRPLFVIHGLADTVVPPAHSERIFAAAGEPKQVWYVPGAGHNGSRQTAGAEYEQRIVAFFRSTLGE